MMETSSASKEDLHKQDKEKLKAAIEEDDVEALRSLLDNGVLIGGSLFTAVRSNSLKCVKELILEMSKEEQQKKDPSLVLPGNIPKKTSLAALNPLMLAIELNRHKIVELFIEKEFHFEHSNNTDKNDEDVRARVLLDFHKLKARANPIYISYVFIHDKNKKLPMSQLYILHKKLLKNSYIDDEYKEDYIKLAHQCEDFAVELINLCHDLDETKEITKFSDSKEKETDIPESLIFLKKAIKRKWDKVVAHPYSQLQLNVEIHPPNVVNISQWCKNSKIEFHRWSNDKWREKSHWEIAGYALWHFIAMPFLAVVYIFDAKRKWRVTKEYMKNPMIKFTSHYSSLLVFVSLLIVSSFQDKFYDELLKPSIPEWLILVWLVGFIVQVAEEILYQKKHYFAQWWNITTFLMLLFFTMSYFLRVIAYGITGTWAVLDPITDFSPTASYKVILLANSFYSLGMLLSFITLSAIFQVNDVLGPLQLSLGHLLYDVLKFAIFFTYIVLGFGLSLRKLYSHYITTQQQIAKMRRASTNGTHHEDHQLTDVGSGFVKLFWALFGIQDLKLFDTKDKNFTITKETGKILFGVFQVIAVIVTINMLIAMMSRSFDDIASDAMVKWKLSRTRLWMNWIQKKIVLPSPLNVIETLVHFTWKYTIGRNKKGPFQQCRTSTEEGIDNESHRNKESTKKESTDEILKKILRRYIAASKEKHKEKEFWARTIHGREGGLNIHHS